MTIGHRYLSAIVAFTLSSVVLAQANVAKDDTDVAVCGSFWEPMLFSIWASVAERQSLPVPEWAHLERLSITMRDGVAIRGFRIKSTSASERPVASLLVVQGNAMLAQTLLPAFDSFSKAGFDVYLFDFRGYGMSGGNRRLKAIVADYVELIEYVSRNSAVPQIQYGISFGGIVLLNANNAAKPVAGLVIDSSPSIVSNQGCPPLYDPVNRLATDATKIALIVGGSDKVVSPNASRGLAELVRARGGRVLENANWAHPLMETTAEAQTERLMTIQSLLLTFASQQKK